MGIKEGAIGTPRGLEPIGQCTGGGVPPYDSVVGLIGEKNIALCIGRGPFGKSKFSTDLLQDSAFGGHTRALAQGLRAKSQGSNRAYRSQSARSQHGMGCLHGYEHILIHSCPGAITE